MASNKNYNVVKYFLPFIVFLVSFFINFSYAYADSLSTASLDLYYIPVSASNYIWRTGMLYNQSQQLWQAKKYQFNTPSVTATGTNAVIHFETNIVAAQPAASSGINQSHYVNLDYMTNLSCSASNGTLSIIGSSLSYARTPWFSNNNNVFNETLTLYGDIALKGFDKNTSGTITCAVGSDDYAFYNSGSQIADNYRLYFEQNPMTIIWTDNNTDNLLQQQISQTQQLIYQNQQLYEQNNQNTQNIINNQSENTQDIIDNQNQNTQDIIRSNQHCYQSQNIFTGWIIGKKLNATNGSEASDNSAASSDFIAVVPNQNYIFSGLPTDLYTFIAAYNSSKQFLGRTGASGSATKGFKAASVFFSSGTPQATGDVSFIRITAYPSGNYQGSVSSINSLQVQLEKGTVASSYNPSGEICKNYNEEYYDEQRQADDNISNQSTSDIDGATNAQTTSLIGTISSFVSALGSIQTGSCELTLPFPNFVGGDTVVNPCSGKEKAPALIAAGSSMLLIGVFVPLAYIVLKMIYNEIRSFTNG